MKLQHLAVIFVIIIMPISLVMTQYIQTQIDTINMQTLYTQSLNNATYDALKAFQINSVNNKYSSISDSKIRDVEASIATFYNSLMTSVDKFISSKEELSEFIPAVVFTLYDGYYIHSIYENIYSSTDDGKVQIDDNNNNYQYGLKPYIYYSCEYKLGTEKIVVNYTLDNSITVYGKLTDTDGNKRYISRSGYLIDYTKVTNIDKTKKTLKYDGVTIEPETLTEHLLIITDDSNIPVEGDYNYIIYNNKKVYQDVNGEGNANGKYFWYDNYKKTYLQSEALGLKQTLDKNGVGFKSISAFQYYLEAYEFSKWLVETSGMREITQENIVQNDETNGNLNLSVDTGNNKIFDTTKDENDPMLSSSIFNAHREAVIRKSIETNLLTAIVNYNIQNLSSFEFTLPLIDEESWYKITNNVSVISFLQGIPMSQKYYNNYSVITNTKNEEVINEQSIYIIAENSSGNLEYHQPGCKELIEMQKVDSSIELIGYTSLSYLRKNVKIDESTMCYYYPQSRNDKMITGCYNCIVNATADYDIDGLIKGKIQDYITGEVLYNENDLKNVRQAYFEVWAREKYDINNITDINFKVETEIESEPIIDIIEFKIDGETYRAETGMTWNDWGDSKYNTRGPYLTNEGIVLFSSGCGPTYSASGSGIRDFVYHEDEIIKGFNYGFKGVAECVFPNSLILTFLDGNTELAENLSEGDDIVYYNFEKNIKEIGKIKKVYIHESATNFVKFTFEDGTYLEATDYHPIYTKEGWKSYTKRNKYEKPKVGDEVKTPNGWKKITKIQTYKGEEDCYDFSIIAKDGTVINNYYANGTLVQASLLE